MILLCIILQSVLLKVSKTLKEAVCVFFLELQPEDFSGKHLSIRILTCSICAAVSPASSVSPSSSKSWVFSYMCVVSQISHTCIVCSKSLPDSAGFEMVCITL